MENSNKINTYNKKTASQQVVGEVGRKMNNRTHLYDCIYQIIVHHLKVKEEVVISLVIIPIHTHKNTAN